jgi:hypothetical protein
MAQGEGGGGGLLTRRIVLQAHYPRGRCRGGQRGLLRLAVGVWLLVIFFCRGSCVGARQSFCVSPTVCLGHGIGGKYIPVNIARLAESQYAGVSDDGLSSPDLTATQNYCKHVDATYYMEFLRRGYPPAHRLKYLTSY